MTKNIFKSMLLLIAVTLIGLCLNSCSDDDDEQSPKLTLSVESTTFDTYQPIGTVALKLNVSDPNEQLLKSMLQISNYNFSGSGNLHPQSMPEIDIIDLIRENNNYIIKLNYDLKEVEFGDAKFNFSYKGQKVSGDIHFNMRRAHLYKDIIEFKTDINKLGKYFFPVYDFLDELNIEHMDYKAIGNKEELYFATDVNPIYPATEKNNERPYFSIPGRSSEGKICMMGLKNAEYSQVYSLINKIKLNQPDTDGNEYIWLEFQFVVLPVE